MFTRFFSKQYTVNPGLSRTASSGLLLCNLTDGGLRICQHRAGYWHHFLERKKGGGGDNTGMWAHHTYPHRESILYLSKHFHRHRLTERKKKVLLIWLWAKQIQTEHGDLPMSGNERDAKPGLSPSSEVFLQHTRDMILEYAIQDKKS